MGSRPPTTGVAAASGAVVDRVVAQLKAAGKDSNRKTYARHGVKPPVFGVSYADLKSMAKSLKRDQPLALALWAQGNHDSRVLATMIAEVSDIFMTPRSVLDRWCRDVENCPLADALAATVARSAEGFALAERWADDSAEYVRRVGYMSLAIILKDGLKEGPMPHIDILRKRLSIIEKEIHASPNRAREGMNAALIALGVYSDELTAEVIATAERIGPVKIDHGDTACRDFPAIAEIKKARAHRAKKGK